MLYGYRIYTSCCETVGGYTFWQVVTKNFRQMCLQFSGIYLLSDRAQCRPINKIIQPPPTKCSCLILNRWWCVCTNTYYGTLNDKNIHWKPNKNPNWGFIYRLVTYIYNEYMRVENGKYVNIEKKKVNLEVMEENLNDAYGLQGYICFHKAIRSSQNKGV